MSTVRAKHYTGSAHWSLEQAILWRTYWRSSGARIDRVIMRQFAMGWRDYLRLAARFS